MIPVLLTVSLAQPAQPPAAPPASGCAQAMAAGMTAATTEIWRVLIAPTVWRDVAGVVVKWTW